MFICDPCLARDYPTAHDHATHWEKHTGGGFRSHGQCEECDQVAACRDIPTSFLARHRGPRASAK